jgi:hypothetical protein
MSIYVVLLCSPVKHTAAMVDIVVQRDIAPCLKLKSKQRKKPAYGQQAFTLKI